MKTDDNRPSGRSTHTNRLAQETSPYLLQHAHQPVDWYSWGEEALERARSEDKPIFLSVGYSACHWCHVMAHESFDDEGIAAFLNEHFISIKVDREERPDLDAIYMDAVQMITGQGGWPLTVFLTPEGRPFHGGTYFPPRTQYGRPGFKEVLYNVVEAYRGRRDLVDEVSTRIVTTMGEEQDISQGDPGTGAGAPAAVLDQGKGAEDKLLNQSVATLFRGFDRRHGGFGTHPKFPQPSILRLILERHARHPQDSTGEMADSTLMGMAMGGIYDQLGGGFHRYSVDDRWLVPHFEKMLYDNAQLLITYLQGWQLWRRPRYLKVVNQTVDYILREMTAPHGGFYSSQDADSDGAEGLFYLWTEEEIRNVVRDPELARRYMGHYGVTSEGNFEGRNILHRNSQPEPLTAEASEGGRPEQEIGDDELVEEIDQLLFQARETRNRPGRDEKIIAEWNGMAIEALARCGSTLNRPEVVAAAARAADFILASMTWPTTPSTHGNHGPGLGLHRTHKDGVPRHQGCLEDYSAMALGLLSLYEATLEERWLCKAHQLATTLMHQFIDEGNGTFFQTGRDHDPLIVRRKDFFDGALPSGNANTAALLTKLGTIREDSHTLESAWKLATAKLGDMGNQPFAHGRMLTCLQDLVEGPRLVKIGGAPDAPEVKKLLEAARGNLFPGTCLRRSENGEEKTDSPGQAGQAAAWICSPSGCQAPITAPEELQAALGQWDPLETACQGEK